MGLLAGLFGMVGRGRGETRRTDWHALVLGVGERDDEVVDKEEAVEGLDEQGDEGVCHGKDHEAQVVRRVGPLHDEHAAGVSVKFSVRQV